MFKLNSEITFGLVGKLWQLDYGKLLFDNTDSFVGFHEPSFAKLILNYRIDKISREKIRLSTETRVFCTDKKAVYCFFPYWCLIRPASGLIRRRILSAIKKTSEAHQKDRILTNSSHPRQNNTD
ncbi:hypothetical protein [Xenorhabdus sp. Sc-CR9]|uniref:hypothetical protein n=1 Tax=Xenorhabdus sp. Sc-CR9 TaxID=2584468 RepID=UPI001F2E722E|nr:hypothetical protein [Xenorhabdus sp. Sc-CR9]